MSRDKPRNGLPCKHCGSSDAAGWVTENGPVHCFSCGKSWRATGEDFDDTHVTVTKEQEKSGLRPVDGQIKALQSRGITADTCKAYNYQVGYSPKGDPIHIANYYRPTDGALSGQQWRLLKEKDFRMVGGPQDFFWGQHKWAKGRRVVICEGQIDAMTVYQVLGKTWPVVSLPNGSQSVKKAFSKQQEWLNSWEEIVLCFDMDEPGRAAILEAVALCPPGKVYTVNLPLKDANQMLMENREAELRDLLWKPKKWAPEAIVSAKDVTSAFLTEQTMGDLWPWKGLNDLTFGRHAGCVYAIASAPGAGKTDFLTELICDDVKAGHKVGAIFLEEAPPEIKELVVSKLAGKLLYYPDSGISSEEKQEWEDKWDALPGELLMVDMTKSEGTYESIEPLVKHLVVAEGCRTIVLDSMTVCWDNHADTSEEYRQRTYKAFTRLIKAYRDKGVHGIVASHLNKPPNTQIQHTAGAQIKQSHMYGSQAIPKLSTFCLGLERNQESEDPEVSNRAKIRVIKARKFGRSGGKLCYLKYDDTTGRLTEDHEKCDFAETDEEKPNGEW